jgi:hypothetical protein
MHEMEKDMLNVNTDAARYREIVLAEAHDGCWLHMKIVTDEDALGALPRGARPAAHLPLKDGALREFPVPHVGTAGALHEHVGAIEVEESGIDLEAVRRDGASFSIVDKKGQPTAWLQGFGDNAPLGATVEVDEHGVAWCGPVAVYTTEGGARAPASELIEISAARLKAGEDVEVELEVYAPGVTTKGALAESTKAKNVRRLGLGVEGKLVPKGHVALRYRGLAGHALNNFIVGWSLSSAKIPARKKRGDYPLRVMLGDEVLREVTIRLV